MKQSIKRMSLGLALLSLWLSMPAYATDTVCDISKNDFGGLVFRDYDDDGQQDSLEPGVAGITIKAFDADNQEVSSAVTGDNGVYVLAGVSNGTAYRLEFSGLADTDKPSTQGVDSQTTVRFETAAARCDVKLGVSNPLQYCQAAPELVTSRFVLGDQLTGSNQTKNTLISINAGWGQYATGKDTNPHQSDLAFWQPVDKKPRSVAIANKVGSIYGIAWDRKNNYLYAAAYHKMQSGYGPGGRGQIYRLAIDPKTGIPTQEPEAWVNVETDLGVTVCGSHGNDLLNQYDTTTFNQVGKCSLGDLDLSEDGQTLFVTNLSTKEIIGIDTVKQVKVGQWAFPTNQASCKNAPDDVRPFGLKYHHGLLYVGAICSGEISRAANLATARDELRAYVYSLDTNTNTWSEVLNYDWSKQRYGIYKTQLDPWLNSMDQIAASRFAKGTPRNWVTDNSQMLTDIEFVGNDIVLGFRGRLADQWGVDLPYSRTTPTVVAALNYTTNTVGDIVCVGYDNATKSYMWESNDHTNNLGVCAGRSASNSGYVHPDTNYDLNNADTRYHNTSLDDGEFYWGDGGAPIYGTTARHYEISQGGLAQIGTGPIIMSALTPPNSLGVGYDQSSGFVWMDNNNGAPTGAYVAYDSSNPESFSKSAGLGDIEALCLPAPVQIGNRVWSDNNKNGIQDPSEAGLANVEITLSCGVNTAKTTTASDGTYYFSNAENGNATFLKTGMLCTLTPGIVPSTTDTYEATVANVQIDTTNHPLVDVRDSDAPAEQGVDFTVGQPGENNHSIDFGFVPLPKKVDLKLTKTVSKSSVGRGEEFIYTLSITNESANPATAVQVKDALPAGLIYVSDDGQSVYAKDVFDELTGLWTVEDVAANQTKTLNITVKAL